MIHIKRDVRDIQRLSRILTVFFEEGLGYYIWRSKLASHVPFLKKLSPVRKINKKKEQAIRLRKAFERLGPTFVKLGQLLSLRPDLVPPEFAEEFTKLQDSVPSIAYSKIKKVVEDELGQSINKTFKNFSKKPIASASMAQVHEAILKSGEKVAVKVQRPKIKKIIDADLDILFFIASAFEKSFSDIKNYQPVGVVKEFALYTRKELDFSIEASNAERLREVLKDEKKSFVPKIYHELSSRRVLIMEFIGGIKLDDFDGIKRLKISRKKLVQNYFDSILDQSLLHGFFHADPHPANIFVQRTGKLVYLDFGIMGQLTKKDRNLILNFFLAAHDKDVEKSLNSIVLLARKVDEKNLPEFKQESLKIMEEVYYHPIGEKSFGKAIYEIISLGAKYGMVFNPNHVLLSKAIYQAEGIALKLDPEFKVADGMGRFTKKYLQKKYSPEEVIKKLKLMVIKSKDVLDDFPEHLQKIISHLEGEDHCHENHNAEEELIRLQQQSESLSNKRTIIMVISLLFIFFMSLLYFEGIEKLMGINLSIIFLIGALCILLYTKFKLSKRGE